MNNRRFKFEISVSDAKWDALAEVRQNIESNSHEDLLTQSANSKMMLEYKFRAKIARSAIDAIGDTKN